MKTAITELAKAVGISDIGFCAGSEYLKNAGGLPQEVSFCGAQGAEAVTAAKTLIVCAFSYYSGAAKGNISRYAQGTDYHSVARKKMEYIVRFLGERGFSGAAFADTGALNERLLARLSGIAFLGRNQMAISKKLGSYFFIGYILTDCEIEPDAAEGSGCVACGKCVAACPLGALDGDFDEKKCLSYITQKKGELSEDEISAMKKAGTIWGCDICQEVCPHNKNIPVTDIKEFKNDLITNLEIDETLSNKEFKRMYENRAFSWRGKNVLIRNQKAIYNK